MAPARCFPAVLFFLLASLATSSIISGGAFDQAYGSAGRSLLQAKKSCSINFEFMNYTVITSKCKGPQYPPKLCCQALKDFACPHAGAINDVSTDCATTMFSYINLYGKYPPGLFASECREGKLGLECPAASPESAGSKAQNNPNGGYISQKLSLLLVFSIGCFSFLHFLRLV